MDSREGAQSSRFRGARAAQSGGHESAQDQERRQADAARPLPSAERREHPHQVRQGRARHHQVRRPERGSRPSGREGGKVPRLGHIGSHGSEIAGGSEEGRQGSGGQGEEGAASRGERNRRTTETTNWRTCCPTKARNRRRRRKPRRRARATARSPRSRRNSAGRTAFPEAKEKRTWPRKKTLSSG